ncbi:putative lysozyme-like protein [Nilaparvata lugens]|uniref:putative lysozyme-like protein n=1 Tax=Nilaparvata lugens TaxID=108931 RepID=UPI00193D74B1|nr:putative lysozyme-like protein [Nilaparvata lugens]
MDTFKYSSLLSLVFSISLLATVLTAPSHHVRHQRSPQTSNNTAGFNPWGMFGGSFAGSSAQAGSFGGGNGIGGGGSGSFAGSSAQAGAFGGGNGGGGSGSFANSAAQAQSISYGPFSGSIATSEANAGSQTFSAIPAFLQRFFGR